MLSMRTSSHLLSKSVLTALFMLCGIFFHAAVQAADAPNELNSELAQIAKSLKPGTWGEWATQGFDDKLIRMGAAGDLMGYTDRATWDPKGHKLHFIGQGHLTPPPRYVTLTEATGEWKIEPTPAWAEPLKWFHAYENNAMDEAKGIFFHHPSASNVVHRLDIAKNEWTKLPDITGAPSGHGTAMVYFPDMKGLVRVLGATAYFYSEETNAWKKLGDAFKAGPYHNMAVYCAPQKAVYFGGGNGSGVLFKLSADGKTAPIKECPIALAISHAILTCDPVSGEIIAMDKDKAVAYNATKDTWAEIDTKAWPFSFAGSMMVTPIPNYGVILFAWSGPKGRKVLVYKHAPSVP